MSGSELHPLRHERWTNSVADRRCRQSVRACPPPLYIEDEEDRSAAAIKAFVPDQTPVTGANAVPLSSIPHRGGPGIAPLEDNDDEMEAGTASGDGQQDF